MGNKLCKKKTDLGGADLQTRPSPFDRIITRLHLRPNSWKSESHLNQKQTDSNPENVKKSAKSLSKSTDWTDASLEVPEKDEAIHLENPKLSLIFDNDKTTPVPPPRKHKKGFREKLEAVAKSGLQAFQSNQNYSNKKPVDEPLCVKKTVKPTCPLDDHDCAIHNRNHKHEQKKNEINETKTKTISDKRKKNLSVVSLPNYNELKLTVATFDDIDKKPSEENPALNPVNDGKKAINNKLETCMTRCRSFGSLLPQQLLDKWRVRKIPTDQIESDDSFGALEDWDLRIIEHYNPKDASLPRPSRKSKEIKNETLTDLESLILKDEEIEKPVAPVRRSDSLSKKIKREEVAKNFAQKTPNKESDDHSSLMKILEKYSILDKQQQNAVKDESPDLVGEIKTDKEAKKREIDSIQDFLLNEKLNVSKDVVVKFGNPGLAQAKV